MSTVMKKVVTGTSRTPQHMFTAQLGDIGKSLKLKRKYGNREPFSSSKVENFSTFLGKYLKLIETKLKSRKAWESTNT